jgi:superfamily II DNA helicase RecQ
VATNSAGMVVNYAGLYQIITYGPPHEVDTYVQQIGRAGRDRKPSDALLVYNRKQLRNPGCTEMTNFVQKEECRRQIYTYYSGSTGTEVLPKHICCDECTKTCVCVVTAVQHVSVGWKTLYDLATLMYLTWNVMCHQTNSWNWWMPLVS